MASEEELLRQLKIHLSEQTTRVVGELRSLREAILGAPALGDELLRLRRIETAARGLAAEAQRPKPYYGTAIWALDQALGPASDVAEEATDGRH